MDALHTTSPIADPRTVVAVAIPDSQLWGEEEEQVYILQQLPGKPANRHGKKRTVLVLWIIAIVAVAAISVGVTCGLGKCSGDDDRAAEMLALINNITLSDQTLQYPALGTMTPEEEALAWLIKNDPLQLDVSTDAERIRQRYALLTLSFHLTEESQMELPRDWLENNHECTWGRITCAANNIVDSIDLALKNLQGRIPDDLGLLTALASLDLNYNSLNGTIPSSLGQLTALQTLVLGSNLFYGTIPSSLGLLTALTSLDLSYNELNGTIPDDLGLLTELTYLGLSLNALNGTIPSSLGLLTALTFLDLSNNSLNGKIPRSLGLLTELNYLVLSYNSLIGTISVVRAVLLLSWWSPGLRSGTRDESRDRVVVDLLVAAERPSS